MIIMAHQSPLKLFLVDDDLFCLKMYELHLGVLGYQDIEIYLSESACLNDLSLKPDVIFLNECIDMSNGPGLLKKIKQFNPDIYVVFICAPEKVEHTAKMLQYGAFDYIVKGDDDLDAMKAILSKIKAIKELLGNSETTFTRNIF
jgi:DNA-binding NtrC family response regulator